MKKLIYATNIIIFGIYTAKFLSMCACLRCAIGGGMEKKKKRLNGVEIKMTFWQPTAKTRSAQYNESSVDISYL